MNQDSSGSDDVLEQFVSRVRESGEVWGLHLDEGWAYCESNEYEETEVLLFWSTRAAAEKHAHDEWSDHKPTAIELPLFLRDWLPGMDEDAALVGLDWGVDLIGDELEPGTIAARLEGDEEVDTDDGE